MNCDTFRLLWVRLLFGFAKLGYNNQIEVCLFVKFVLDLFPLWVVLKDLCDKLYEADQKEKVVFTYSSFTGEGALNLS